jgi:hypothetical protein
LQSAKYLHKLLAGGGCSFCSLQHQRKALAFSLVLYAIMQFVQHIDVEMFYKDQCYIGKYLYEQVIQNMQIFEKFVCIQKQ